jgi:predicted metal-dependent hydrolase
MSDPAEPLLTAEGREAFRLGIEQFNRGLYYECHDTLEEIWSGARGPARDFLQGLIQVAVAYYHLSSGNAAGARSLFARALRRLEGYGTSYLDVDLESVRAQAREALSRLERGEPPAQERPRWRRAASGSSR